MKIFAMSTDVAVENVLKAQIPEQVFIDESFFFLLRVPIVYPPKGINKTKVKKQKEKNKRMNSK